MRPVYPANPGHADGCVELACLAHHGDLPGGIAYTLHQGFLVEVDGAVPLGLQLWRGDLHRGDPAPVRPVELTPEDRACLYRVLARAFTGLADSAEWRLAHPREAT